jgi:oxygen-independent coproporphyrinogen-3 oxidase
VFHVKQARPVTGAGFGLYVHWPFCESKCPYCDFNSHVGRTGDPRRWRDAYRHEIQRIAAETGTRPLRSIFFGGGTPSLMEPEIVADVIAAARAAWPPANDIEITLEANPGSADAGRFADYAGAGVNRVSVGVQALDDDSLRRLGRKHTAADALRAVALARTVFPRVSLDLIYARQWQDRDGWVQELRRALDVGTDHLSLYQLTIEPGTVFAARHAAGQLSGLPDDERAADLYDATQELCAAAGLPAYEISNHARPGSECRHNLIYWEGGDYAGIGPGAHGRLTLASVRHATTSHRLPARWLDAVETRGSGEEERVALDPAEVALERLLMGLRLARGVPLDDFAPAFRPPAEVVASVASEGLVEVDAGRLRVTHAGRLLTDRITRILTAHLC